MTWPREGGRVMCEHKVGGFEDSKLRCVDTSGRPHTHVFHGETVDDGHTASEAMED